MIGSAMQRLFCGVVVSLCSVVSQGQAAGLSAPYHLAVSVSRPVTPFLLVQWGQGWGGQPQSPQEDPSLRTGALENRVRQLTGQVEQLQFQIRRLEDQLKRFQEDVEFRFQEQQSGTSPAGTQPRRPQPGRPGTPPGQQRGDVTPSDPSAPLALTPGLGPGSNPGAGSSPIGGVPAPRSSVPGQPQLGTPPQVLGQLPADPRSGQPLDTGNGPRSQIATAGLPTAPLSGLPPTANAREAYDQAYGFVLRGEYDRAESSFQSYLAAYPDDRQNGDALYWLGESQFQRQQWKPAAESFLKGYNDFPNGSKAPESLLRLGMSLRQLGQKEPACATFNEVLRKYPRASPAVKQRVQSEQRSAAC